MGPLTYLIQKAEPYLGAEMYAKIGILPSSGVCAAQMFPTRVDTLYKYLLKSPPETEEDNPHIVSLYGRKSMHVAGGVLKQIVVYMGVYENRGTPNSRVPL